MKCEYDQDNKKLRVGLVRLTPFSANDGTMMGRITFAVAALLVSPISICAVSSAPSLPALPNLQHYRDAGYLECPLALAETAWSCWRTDPKRAEAIPKQDTTQP